MDVACIDVVRIEVAVVDMARIDVAAVDAAHVDVADMDMARVDVADVDVARVDVADVDVARVDVADVDVVPSMWGLQMWPLGVDVADRHGSCHPTTSFVLTPCPTTPSSHVSSSSSPCVLSSLGYVADVDVVRVDVAALTGPG